MDINSKSKKTKSPRWASRLGFIMTAAGAAVGLGNLQRFPQLVALHGGGAFLLLYLLCVLLFGLPLMLTEISLGRAMRSDPVNSFKLAAPNKPFWKYVGGLGALIAFCILSYYTVSCSWTLAFMLKSFTNKNLSFDIIAKNPNNVIFYLLIFHSLVTLIVLKGLNQGVEKFSKIVMPLMFVIQIILIIKILSMKGSWEGFIHYLKPDFTKLRSDSVLNALSQAFFSLCVGEAVLLTYGSFASKNESLPLSASYIAILDTSVAFLAGLIIIPAVFITKQDPTQGMGLIYNTLFTVFEQMKGGDIFLVLYFVILAIAGLTTCITLLDVSSHTFSKTFKLSKNKSVLLISLLALILGIPSLYSKGGSEFFTNMVFLGQKGFCDIMDFVWGSIGMVVCGLLTTIFVGWIWGTKNAMKELSINASIFNKIKKIWAIHIKWTAPLIIIYILKTLISLI
ncbi:MAG: sodium-dependent transporter [Bacteroidetes bacterium]|nr:sodium-dependent transporter [Bacteroidota bacterium]